MLQSARLKIKSNGFTLVELLITVSVLVILSGALLLIINPDQARAKSRDAIRAGNLASIQNALELYRIDNKRYPQLAGNYWVTLDKSTDDTISDLLESGNYISSMPTDPKQTGSSVSDPCSEASTYNYFYRSDFNGSYYLLAGQSETASTASSYACSSLKQWSNSGCVVSTSTKCIGFENKFK